MLWVELCLRMSLLPGGKEFSMQVSPVTTGGRSSDICPLSHGKWVTRERRSSLTCLPLFLCDISGTCRVPCFLENITVFFIFCHPPGEHTANILKEGCIKNVENSLT